MTNLQGGALTASGVFLFCIIHFFTTVYQADEPQLRELNPAALTLADNGLPYNADTLQQLVAAWSLPVAADNVPEQALADPLAGYDNTMLGDTSIALLAIYQQQQHKAVLAVQIPGQPLNFVHLLAGDSVGDIILSQVSQREVTVTRGSQQVKLRLFKPGSASSE
ncbi:hypothetical protein [Arsukibacterium perlucidum]|uniref:hypothetical protein n=1 Tax=Arsukibacterium perlucidum TaxID=368811 RepID=UPI000365D5EB|nr:hypothetical protein [Arsukibacterium perlucidum]